MMTESLGDAIRRVHREFAEVGPLPDGYTQYVEEAPGIIFWMIMGWWFLFCLFSITVIMKG